MHILIADDDAGTRLIVAAAVERLGHECTVAEDGAEAWRRFAEVRPDVVIADWEMPGMDGTELTRRIRSQVDVPYPYVIVLTARAGHDQALGAMEAGADDLVFKPLPGEALERMLVGAARVTALHRRLHRDARQDALTGLGNRRRLSEDLQAMHARAQRYGHRWCVALVDVDRFKPYNDAGGHLEGDRLLRRVAGALAATVRGGDTVYRYGGEEFLVLLPEQTLETAALAAERLRGAVEDLAVPHPDGGVVTVSAGVAGPAAGTDSVDALVGRADAALYAAKAAGRNRVEVARAEETGDAPIRLMIADDDELIRMLVTTIAEHEPALDLVGTASDATEAVKVAVMRRPQVVLLDVDMPRGGGVQAAIDIQRELPETRIVALSANESQFAMLDMARAGAVGYIVKGAPPAEIVDTIRSSARF
jgi:two-component system chemotaxis response regulator CheY